MTNEKPEPAIGVFDSGVGGLSVLNSIFSRLPFENTVYIGDTARVPYGTKSAKIVTEYAIEIGSFLDQKNIKAIVAACNTVSAVALPTLKQRFSHPIVGMVEPAVNAAVNETKNKKIGVIGTEGTIRSGAYEKAIREMGSFEIKSKACPLFVPLAEEGWTDNDIAISAAKTYLDDFRRAGVDTLILGCTHYPMLAQTIQKVMGDSVSLVDSGAEASIELQKLLSDNCVTQSNEPTAHSYYVTDTPDRFIRIGEKFLGQNVKNVHHVDIP